MAESEDEDPLATRWSLVARAADSHDPVGRQRAVDELYEIYRDALLGFMRRRGISEDKAQDLLHDLWIHLLSQDRLKRPDPAKGRFRAWLATTLKHLIENARRYEQARGAGKPHFVIDDRFAGVDRDTTDRFDLEWVRTLVGRALRRLRERYDEHGEHARFEALKQYLEREEHDAVATLAQTLDVSPGAARKAAHDFRIRFREFLEDEIGQTVTTRSEFEAERHHLRRVLERLKLRLSELEQESEA